MLKERFELAASSLSSYFGVGFNTPEEQIQYDLGNQENTFDEASMDRMTLGTMLEDAALNYAEYKLKILITNRNVDVVTAFDGMVRCKLDGETIFNGEPTCVENKVSNSAAKKFTEDLGYYLQCQTYMETTGHKQTLLCGLWNGKFIWKIIPRDEKTIEQIRTIVEFVHGVLSGVNDMADFPYEVTDEFAGRVSLTDVPVEQLTDDDVDFMDELFALKTDFERKRMESREKELTDYLKSKFQNQKVETDLYTCAISMVSMKGSVDLDELKNDNPDLDLEKYRKPSTEYAKVDIRAKKVKK